MNPDELAAELNSIPMMVTWEGKECEVLSANKDWLFALTPLGALLAQVGRDSDLVPFAPENLISTLRLADQGHVLEIRARVGAGESEILDPADTRSAFRRAFERWLPHRPAELDLDADDWSWLWSEEAKES